MIPVLSKEQAYKLDKDTIESKTISFQIIVIFRLDYLKFHF